MLRGATAVFRTVDNCHEGMVIVGDNDANGQATENKEDTESSVCGLKGVLDMDAGTLGFCGEHGEIPWNPDRR